MSSIAELLNQLNHLKDVWEHEIKHSLDPQRRKIGMAELARIDQSLAHCRDVMSEDWDSLGLGDDA